MIQSIKIRICEREVELSVDDAKKLRDELNSIFAPAHPILIYPIIQPSSTGNTPWLPETTWCSPSAATA
jgi:hypothetical protein